MSETTIYYSVRNCGDGSAYPSFFANERMAEFDQENQSEGWGEPCTGSLTIEHEGEIVVKGLTTLEDMVADCWDEDEAEKLSGFLDELIEEADDEAEIERMEKLKVELAEDD
jgi:hypothetical protein